jgi:hypothetical protein
LIPRLSTFPGIEFPQDCNIADQILKLINANKSMNALENASNFRQESFERFESTEKIQQVKSEKFP